MAVCVRLPKLAPSMEVAMVGTWRKSLGEFVNRGEALVELITDKATFDFESDAEGVLLSITAPTKSSAPVNYILCVVGEAGETPPDVSAENAAVMAAWQSKAAVKAWTAPLKAGAAPSGQAARATPSARRLARELGVNVDEVAAALGAAVVKDDDVRRFLEGRGAGAPDTTRASGRPASSGGATGRRL